MEELFAREIYKRFESEKWRYYFILVKAIPDVNLYDVYKDIQLLSPV